MAGMLVGTRGFKGCLVHLVSSSSSSHSTQPVMNGGPEAASVSIKRSDFSAVLKSVGLCAPLNIILSRLQSRGRGTSKTYPAPQRVGAIM